MLSVLAITVPIYACVAVGYVAVRFGVLARADMKVLTTFVVTFALPCMLFLAIGSRRVQVVLVPTYLAAYAVGSVLVYAAGWFWGRRSGRGAGARAFDALGMCGCNSGFVGYPLMLLTLPDIAGLALGLNMIVENLLILPVTFLLAEGRADAGLSRADRLRGYAGRLTRNPLLVGLAAGLVVSATGIGLPDVVVRTADLFGRAGAAVSLFAVGGLLTGMPRGQALRRIVAITAGKLVAHPLVVFGVLTALVALGLPVLPDHLRIALLVTAALPVFSILPVLAHPYGQEEPMAAVLLATTATSFLTLSALLGLLGA
jgi:predicted permease